MKLENRKLRHYINRDVRTRSRGLRRFKRLIKEHTGWLAIYEKLIVYHPASRIVAGHFPERWQYDRKKQ